MMRLRLCRALWRWLARPLAVFKAGFWMRYWLAANERNEHLGDRIEQLQEDILILRQRFDEERMEKELAQAFAKSAYAEARQAREQLEAIKAGSRN